ncbi:MAG: cyclic lactone autoinducer peptide [Limnochordia bacterium]|jgi:cyclic lactone autoinducer peptide|nr:cyclic lactone autoinducer peptide [Limnochordia bacterium]
MKRLLLTLAAAAAMVFALVNVSSASLWVFHQPEVPKSLRD